MKILLIIMSLGGNNVVPMDSMILCLQAANAVIAAAPPASRTNAICTIQGK